MKFEVIRRHRPLRAFLGFVLFLGGCGGDDGGPMVYPVSGKVLVDGKPAEKARITFHPSSGPASKETRYAETDAEGLFRPSTRLTGDGAPAGDYLLTIVWPEIKIDHGEEVSGQDRLGGRYRDPQTANLKVTIKEGENSLLPFELKSSGPSSPRASGSGDRGR